MVSLDNVSWTTVLTIPNTGSLVNAGVLTLNLSPSVEARYFKIVDTASAPGNYPSLHEIYAYAQERDPATLRSRRPRAPCSGAQGVRW